MSALVAIPINAPPGVVATESDRVAAGRWVPPYDKCRFVHGRPQKIGGIVRVTSTQMSGTPRGILCWQDYVQNGYIAAGTYRKLYAIDTARNVNDITPFQSSGTLPNNPFTTASGSNVVQVTLATNLAVVGDTFIFSGAPTFNGVTMNGTFLVNTVIDLNNFTVIATTAATATGAGGGAAVSYQHEISIGSNVGALGQGWGTGGWGTGPWGTARGGGSSTIISPDPRVWSLDHFGQILIATYNGGQLWFFDPTQTQPWPRAVSTFGGVQPVGAPTNCRAMFITPERFVFTLCANMVVNVCSQGDPTTWIPATTNTAFARTLQYGSKLVDGLALQPFISMIWSDSAAYLFQYTGSQFLYNSSLAGLDCGLISPNAAVAVDGLAYWMGPDNFYLYNGSVAPLPNVEDIRHYVFENLPIAQAYQCAAVYVPKFHEIWWFYPIGSSLEPNAYVIYHINDQCWSIGAANFYSAVNGTSGRSAGSHFSAGDTSPYIAAPDGFIYNHDGATIPLVYDDNGQPLAWTLTLSPYSVDGGKENLNLEGVDFDFFELSGSVTATITTFDRLSLTATTDSQTQIIPGKNAGITDYRVAGRYLQLSLTSSDLGGYMRLGSPVAYARSAGTRR